ncbi:mediator of RNA polymerase II transcription subunit 1-domain-containing protein [Phyllosticta capitalensis]|uniref:mediator of RNA polymerase II transcription subunit 1-domain-containing protein n=1 Tax=Phyllosticta capitalensis TaxID=121624 RepID=UPI00312D7E29
MLTPNFPKHSAAATPPQSGSHQHHQNQHLGAFSPPAPRSVPSPAAQRSSHHAAKSPFNASAAQMAHNHPTVSSASGSKTLIGSSPAGGGLNLDSPGALNLGLGVLGGLEGGVGMGISMSGMSGLGLGMGLGSSMGGRPDDTEQRKRLESIIATLKARPGRVSKEGVERLAKQVGMSSEVLSDAAGEQLLLAHTSILLDVTFRDDLVSNVGASFGALSEAVQKHENSAARVLKDDLTPERGLPSINLSLDRFAKNLEKLARHDTLSIFKDGKPEVSCFEAINGVYISLQRLFEHEKKAALHLLDVSRPNARERAARQVLCKKSGRPRMNANKQVGLSLEYWMERRCVFSRPEQTGNGAIGSPMDVDGDESYDESLTKIYSLTLECESSPAQLYPSIRVSDQWISESVEKPSDPNDLFASPVIDWLDPPPTYSGASDSQNDPMVLDGNGLGKVPDVRFVAKLNPPLALPLNVAQSILASVNVQLNQESIKWSTSLESLVMRPDEEMGQNALAADFNKTKEFTSSRNVLVIDKEGKEQDRQHWTTLFAHKAEVACILEEIPFHHPRQLIQVLPVLRQYAHLSTLLQSPFQHPLSQEASISNDSPPALPPLALNISLNTQLDPSGAPSPTLYVSYPRNLSESQISFRSAPGLSNGNAQQSAVDSLDALFADANLTAPASTDPNAMDLDGLLSGGAVGGADPPTVLLAVSILPNADVTIASQDLLPDAIIASEESGKTSSTGIKKEEDNGATGPKSEKQRQEEESRKFRVLGKWGKALELAGDVGLWVEWVKKFAEQKNGREGSMPQ